MPSPEILSGLRQPRAVRMEEQMAAVGAVAPSTPEAPTALAGVNVYVSKYRRYRVQITSPQTVIGPDGRKQTGGKMLVAQFDEGVYRNTHPDPATRALIDETLQSNKYFGKFGSTAEFWLASEQNERTKAAAIEAALRTLRTLPKEAVDTFIGALKAGDAEDHEVPEATTAQAQAAGAAARRARPIPSEAQ